jgi:hypothetical protein
MDLQTQVKDRCHCRHGGTLSPRQLAAFLSPCKTALRREQRQRHSRFLFRFRLFRLFSFPVGSSLPFRHNTLPYVDHPGSKIYVNIIWKRFQILLRKSEKFRDLLQASQALACRRTECGGAVELHRHPISPAHLSRRNGIIRVSFVRAPIGSVYSQPARRDALNRYASRSPPLAKPFCPTSSICCAVTGFRLGGGMVV